MSPHTSPEAKRLPVGPSVGLLAVLLICLTWFGSTLDAQAQYEVRKPAGTTAQKASITVTDPSAGTTWAKGKRYEVTWQSTGIRGNVKVELVDAQGKATVLARQTMNSGKYSFMLMQNVADGDYTIRISSVDNKTSGVTSATVLVGQTADKGAEPVTTGAAQPMGTTGTVNQAAVTTTATVGTVTRDPVQLDDSPEITAAAGDLVQLGNMTPLQVPERDLQQVILPNVANMETPDFMDQNLQQMEPNNPTITVNDPDADDFWVAGTQYRIRWGSDNVDGPVKIHLVQAVNASQYDFYPVTYNTPNTGAFTYTPPAMLGCGHDGFYIQISTLNEQTKGFAGPIHVYHSPVDMTCAVSSLAQRVDVDNYVFHKERDEWLEFDVMVRNNGTQQSTTIQTVRVLVIKEPEEVLIADGHVEFGFGNMAPRVWYKTPDPLRFDISHWETWTQNNADDIDLAAGAYRVEVTADPLNLLNEDPALRADNDYVLRFIIR